MIFGSELCSQLSFYELTIFSEISLELHNLFFKVVLQRKSLFG